MDIVISIKYQYEFQIDLTLDMAQVRGHALHCVANQDGSAHLILSGGYSGNEDKQIMKIFIIGNCQSE